MEKEKPQSGTEFEINRKLSYAPCFEANANFLSRMFFLWTH